MPGRTVPRRAAARRRQAVGGGPPHDPPTTVRGGHGRQRAVGSPPPPLSLTSPPRDHDGRRHRRLATVVTVGREGSPPDPRPSSLPSVLRRDHVPFYVFHTGIYRYIQIYIQIYIYIQRERREGGEKERERERDIAPLVRRTGLVIIITYLRQGSSQIKYHVPFCIAQRCLPVRVAPWRMAARGPCGAGRNGCASGDGACV